MTNPDHLAHPVGGCFTDEEPGLFQGLTKREHFAALAMQGLCADRHHEDTQAHPKYIALLAVECAEALIAELNKPVKS